MLGFDQYKTVVLMDADMFFKKPINISEYMEDYALLGSWREQVIKYSHPLYVPPEDIKQLTGKRVWQN